jgi:hypothetical protein
VSVEFLRFIPTDPEYDPPLAAGQQARELLASFVPKAAAIEVEHYDTVNFVDNGENLERIFCPACGALLGVRASKPENCTLMKNDVQDIVLQITDGCNIFCLGTLYWLRYLTHSYS